MFPLDGYFLLLHYCCGKLKLNLPNDRLVKDKAIKNTNKTHVNIPKRHENLMQYNRMYIIRNLLFIDCIFILVMWTTKKPWAHCASEFTQHICTQLFPFWDRGFFSIRGGGGVHSCSYANSNNYLNNEWAKL